jgi:hypothetical protein
MGDTTNFGLFYVQSMAILTGGDGHSMRDKDEPDYAADDKGDCSSNEYLLQYFHIFLLIRMMCTAIAM